jgi:hypothetical protein
VLKLEDSKGIRCNSRICHTGVRFLEELWTVINSCVLSLECNKLPLWIEPANLLQYSLLAGYWTLKNVAQIVTRTLYRVKMNIFMSCLYCRRRLLSFPNKSLEHDGICSANALPYPLCPLKLSSHEEPFCLNTYILSAAEFSSILNGWRPHSVYFFFLSVVDIIECI